MSASFPSPSPCRRPRRPSRPRRPRPFLLPFAGRVPCASVPCRTSTAILCCQCSLPDLNRYPPRPVFPCRTSTGRKNVRRDARTFARKNVRQNDRRYARKNVRQNFWRDVRNLQWLHVKHSCHDSSTHFGHNIIYYDR